MSHHLERMLTVALCLEIRLLTDHSDAPQYLLYWQSLNSSGEKRAKYDKELEQDFGDTCIGVVPSA